VTTGSTDTTADPEFVAAGELLTGSGQSRATPRGAAPAITDTDPQAVRPGDTLSPEAPEKETPGGGPTPDTNPEAQGLPDTNPGT
jgi:hypothetical protein